MALKHRVEKRSLVERVRLIWVTVEVDKHLAHGQRLITVFDDTRAEHCTLLKVLFFFQLRNVDAVVADRVNHFWDRAFFYLIKKRPNEILRHRLRRLRLLSLPSQGRHWTRYGLANQSCLSLWILHLQILRVISVGCHLSRVHWANNLLVEVRTSLHLIWHSKGLASSSNCIGKLLGLHNLCGHIHRHLLLLRDLLDWLYLACLSDTRKISLDLELLLGVLLSVVWGILDPLNREAGRVKGLLRVGLGLLVLVSSLVLRTRSHVGFCSWFSVSIVHLQLKMISLVFCFCLILNYKLIIL